MDEILCGISAFRLHRTPPQVLMLCPPLLDASSADTLAHPLAREILGLPLRTLATERNNRKQTRTVATQLWCRPIPLGGIRDTILDVQVCSPLFTLLTLAAYVPETHLEMAMYEFCGTFSVYKPSASVEDALARAETQHLFPAGFGWRRVKDASGNATDLWRRPPLVELDELRKFADDIQGMHGKKIFVNASRAITGIAASPFESQLSLLWGLPQRKGGKGIFGFTNNAEIRLTRKAKLLYPHERCYGDLFWEGSDAHGPLDVECQGAVIHDDGGALISDSDRTTALNSMGIEVVPVTYRQIISSKSFDAVTDLIEKKLGIRRHRAKIDNSKREQELRNELFVDWNALGTYRRAPN